VHPPPRGRPQQPPGSGDDDQGPGDVGQALAGTEARLVNHRTPLLHHIEYPTGPPFPAKVPRRRQRHPPHRIMPPPRVPWRGGGMIRGGGWGWGGGGAFAGEGGPFGDSM
ncbi:hypothetical protein ADK70_25340, partial [Streptomyces rimosus subsp. pseudoverticillatus]